jgi:hypothetical protein
MMLNENDEKSYIGDLTKDSAGLKNANISARFFHKRDSS